LLIDKLQENQKSLFDNCCTSLILSPFFLLKKKPPDFGQVASGKLLKISNPVLLPS